MSGRRSVLDLSIEPPEVVCVDTSALIRALFDDQPQHADYLGFFARVAEAGSTIVYSELLDLELAHNVREVRPKQKHSPRGGTSTP